MWDMAIAAGSNLLGSALGASSAKSAAKEQARAANRATAIQQEAGYNVRQDLAPYRNLGTNATNKLQQLLGIAPAASTREGALQQAQTLTFSESDPLFRKLVADFQEAHKARFGGEMTRSWTDDPDAQKTYQQLVDQWRGLKADELMAQAQANPQQQGDDYGMLLKQFTGEDLESDPGFVFASDEGQKALDRRLSAGGGYFSGAALKAASRYNNDFATTKFDQAYQRDAQDKNRIYSFLSGGASLGQNAAAQTGNAGVRTAESIAQTQNGLGDALGAAAIAQGNAFSSGINNFVSGYRQNALVDKILEGNRGWGASKFGSGGLMDSLKSDGVF